MVGNVFGNVRNLKAVIFYLGRGKNKNGRKKDERVGRKTGRYEQRMEQRKKIEE